MFAKGKHICAHLICLAPVLARYQKRWFRVTFAALLLLGSAPALAAGKTDNETHSTRHRRAARKPAEHTAQTKKRAPKKTSNATTRSASAQKHRGAVTHAPPHHPSTKPDQHGARAMAASKADRWKTGQPTHEPHKPTVGTPTDSNRLNPKDKTVQTATTPQVPVVPSPKPPSSPDVPSVQPNAAETKAAESNAERPMD